MIKITARRYHLRTVISKGMILEWRIKFLTPTSMPPSLRKGGVQKCGLPLDTNRGGGGLGVGVFHTTMHYAPMARHSGVAARAVILCPFETRFCDAIGLGAFSSLPLVGFCKIVDG